METYLDPDIKEFSGMEGPCHIRMKSSLQFSSPSAEECFDILVLRRTRSVVDCDLA